MCVCFYFVHGVGFPSATENSAPCTTVGNYKSVGQSASAVLIQLLQSEDANPRLAGIQAMARVAENCLKISVPPLRLVDYAPCDCQLLHVIANFSPLTWCAHGACDV